MAGVHGLEVPATENVEVAMVALAGQVALKEATAPGGVNLEKYLQLFEQLYGGMRQTVHEHAYKKDRA